MTTPADDTRELHARLEALEREVARRRDLDAIQDVLARYARAVDWLDEALLAAVFPDDAEIDYGFFRGCGRDFRPILMEIERSVDKRWHATMQVSIDLQGDVAHVRSYQFSVSTLPGASRPQTDLLHAYGFYLDRMEKRDGAWCIARRRHVAVGGTVLPDVGREGLFATLNHLVDASPTHPDYR